MPGSSAPATREQQKERVAALADALESGRYVQGRHRLRYATRTGEVRNCCLGVACDVFAEATGTGEWALSDDDDGGYEAEAAEKWVFIVPGERPADLILPDTVARWYGFRETDSRLGVTIPGNPALRAHGSVESATSLNDSSGKSLPEIGAAFRATYVDAEPPPPSGPGPGPVL